MEARFVFTFAAVAALFAIAAFIARRIAGSNQWEIVGRGAVQSSDTSALPTGGYIARRKVNGVWQHREPTPAEVENENMMWAIR